MVFLYFMGKFTIIFLYYNSFAVCFTFFAIYISNNLVCFVHFDKKHGFKISVLFVLNVFVITQKKRRGRFYPQRFAFSIPLSGRYPDCNLRNAFRRG